MNTTVFQVEINSIDAPLFEALMKKFKTKPVKLEEKKPTKMTKEEFFAKIDKGLQQYETGKVKEFNTFKDFQNYITR